MPQADLNNPGRPTLKTRTVSIFGGYSAKPQSVTYELSYQIGRGLAEAGFEVLNGGYAGTMEASSRGAQEAGGVTIGVTCPSVIHNANGPLKPNPFLDEIYTAPDLLARIDTMMRSGGGYVVLEGGTGTLCELAVVWEFVSKGFVPRRPIALAGGAWGDLADRMETHRAASVKYVHQAATATEIVEIMKEHAVAGTRARMGSARHGDLSDETTSVAELRDLVDRFVQERDWGGFHDPKNLSASIAIEAGELMEHFQWLRSDQLDQVRADDEQMKAVREEVADVFAYLLSFADTMKIDLASALADKMRKNAVKYPAAEYRGRFK